MVDDALTLKYGLSRDGHAIIAPSAAAGWMNCSAFVLVNARARDDAGIDAAYGTVAHSLAEGWHKNGEDFARSLVGLVVKSKAGGNTFEIEIDEAMFDHVGRYVQWCNEVPGDHYYEQRVDLSPIMPIPGQGGTADHFACQPFILTITDLKMGTGVRVYAAHNPQAMLYALGVFFEWDWIYGFQRIVIRICQPRLDVFEVWECSREELLAFASYARERAFAAWQENAPRSPSPKACQWCKAQANCPARISELDAIVNDTFDGLCEEDRKVTFYEGPQDVNPPVTTPDHLVDVEPISTASLAATLKLRKHVDKWFAAIADELLTRAEDGQQIPGFKLTDGRTKLYFDNEVAAVKWIEAEYGLPMDKHSPRKLLSPAKIVKLAYVKGKRTQVSVKSDLSKFTGKIAAKRTLASDKDERTDVFRQAEDDFDVEDDGDEL